LDKVLAHGESALLDALFHIAAGMFVAFFGLDMPDNVKIQIGKALGSDVKEKTNDIPIAEPVYSGRAEALLAVERLAVMPSEVLLYQIF